MILQAMFDGSCPQNPGYKAAIGVIIRKDGKVIKRISRNICTGELLSNNVAEYAACSAALEYFIQKNLTGETILLYGDSTIVVNAIIRKKVSKGLCAPYSKETLGLSKKFKDLRPVWIPREENMEADKLSKTGA